MRSTERKLKKLANALPKSKTALLFPDEEEKARLPLFSKVAIPLMAVLICFCLTLAVSAEVREAVFGLFKNNPVSSEQNSSEAPVSSDYGKRGPKAFYTTEELADVTPTETKEGVDEFVELYAEKYKDTLGEDFDIEHFKETVINVTPKNIRNRTDVHIFRMGEPDFFGYRYYVMYENDLYFVSEFGFLNSALICDYNDDGNEEIVMSIYHQTSGVYSYSTVAVFDTASKKMITAEQGLVVGLMISKPAVECAAYLTYASEDDAAEGIFFYATICTRLPSGNEVVSLTNLDHQFILGYQTIGDIRLNDEGRLYYHEYTEEELLAINSDTE